MGGIKDISQITGLSVATISRVFNDSPLVSEKTRKRVLDAAEKLNYRHNRIAAALRSGKSKTIGVIVPEISNHFFAKVINGAEQALAERGYSAIITQSHDASESEQSALESLLKLNVDGILVSCAMETHDYRSFERLAEEGIPLVFFDRLPDFPKCNAVLLDDFHGGKMATQHLIDQGCRHLLHVAGDSRVSIFNSRKSGFFSAVAEAGPAVESHTLVSLGFEMEKDLGTIGSLLEKQPEIDGIFCYGDKLAIRMLNILGELDYAVPQKIKLIGFGNNEYTEFTSPKLSTIDQKCHEMGKKAVEVLIDALDSENEEFRIHTLIPELVIRGSSKRSSATPA